MEIEAAVIGGGVMGLSAAWRLALAGHEVAVFERARIGHLEGSSHGATRIYRLVYDHPAYVAMAQRALPLWRELERDDVTLLTQTGGIDIGSEDELSRCAEAMRAHGAAFEWLTPTERRARFSWLEADDLPGLYAPDTGVLAADATVATLARRARDAGAAIIEDTPVSSLDVGDDRVRFMAGDTQVRARRAIVTAGAWAGSLLRDAGIDLPLRVTREQVSFFGGDTPTMPVIQRGPAFMYTVPALHGAPGLKIGDHVTGPTVEPDSAPRHDSATEARIVAWARARLPGVDPMPLAAETCLYTMTPDEDFVLDARGPLIVASPCSGHGFKFAPLIGEALARLVRGEAPPFPLAMFGLGRFGA